MFQVHGGALDKTKQLGLYRDGWLTDASLHADQFSDADVDAIFHHRASRDRGRARRAHHAHRASDLRNYAVNHRG